MICLYHGTNMTVDVIDPARGRRGTDFGQGFYLTPDRASAERMARRVVMRKGGKAVVLAYKMDETILHSHELSIRAFPSVDIQWLRFIVANRYGLNTAAEHNLDRRFDIVHGLVADDKVVRILDDLRNAEIAEADALAMLRAAPFQTVQYSFHTTRAIAFLERSEVLYV